MLKNEDDYSLSVILENVIIVKIGSGVVQRKNIDVSKGLVNKLIGIVEKILWNFDCNYKYRKKITKPLFKR